MIFGSRSSYKLRSPKYCANRVREQKFREVRAERERKLQRFAENLTCDESGAVVTRWMEEGGMSRFAQILRRCTLL